MWTLETKHSIVNNLQGSWIIGDLDGIDRPQISVCERATPKCVLLCVGLSREPVQGKRTPTGIIELGERRRAVIQVSSQGARTVRAGR